MLGPAKIVHSRKEPTVNTKQSESISRYLDELHTPAFQPDPKPKKLKPAASLNLKTQEQAKGSARFVLGLSNRVVKMDRRLSKLETHVEHLVHNQISSRQLFLGAGFLALIFCSLFIGFQAYSPSVKPDNHLELSLLQAINQSPDKQQRKAALSLLAELSNNNTIQSWANTQLEGSSLVLENRYRWPLEKQQYTPTGVEYEPYKRGINIPAKLGDPVVAMAPGTVVYSGHGIAGYGNLILIQHEDEVISVYGNNYSNYVQEGLTVKQGQLIAAVGEGAGKRSALYFEIRHKGEPEDPFLYFNQ